MEFSLDFCGAGEELGSKSSRSRVKVRGKSHIKYTSVLFETNLKSHFTEGVG